MRQPVTPSPIPYASRQPSTPYSARQPATPAPSSYNSRLPSTPYSAPHPLTPSYSQAPAPYNTRQPVLSSQSPVTGANSVRQSSVGPPYNTRLPAVGQSSITQSTSVHGPRPLSRAPLVSMSTNGCPTTSQQYKGSINYYTPPAVNSTSANYGTPVTGGTCNNQSGSAVIVSGACTPLTAGRQFSFKRPSNSPLLVTDVKRSPLQPCQPIADTHTLHRCNGPSFSGKCIVTCLYITLRMMGCKH